MILASAKHLNKTFLASSCLLLAMSLAACSSTPDGRASVALSSATPHTRSSVEDSAFLPAGRPTRAPTGYLEMCARAPEDCRKDQSHSLASIQAQAQASLADKRQHLAAAQSYDAAPATVVMGKTPPSPLPALNVSIAYHSRQARPLARPLPDFTMNLQSLDASTTTQATLAFNNFNATTSGQDVANNQRPSAADMALDTAATSDPSTVDEAETGMNAAPVERVAFSRASMDMLTTVNAEVNALLIADTDQDIYSLDDFWTAPGLARGTRGDCEDFALEKQHILAQRGVPLTAMSIAIVKTRQGTTHAVLIVSTDKGDYILDNLFARPFLWNKAGYHWVSRQISASDLGWVAM